MFMFVPSARFPFDAEREAGVRTAGLLAHQTPEKLSAIQSAIEKAVGRYAKEGGFFYSSGRIRDCRIEAIAEGNENSEREDGT